MKTAMFVLLISEIRVRNPAVTMGLGILPLMEIT
jgi:hypothetical protein